MPYNLKFVLQKHFINLVPEMYWAVVYGEHMLYQKLTIINKLNTLNKKVMRYGTTKTKHNRVKAR